ncbi:FecR family protein [Chitinophaga rhizophila]|uniref:FecR domain-containing protein n=1 Tax=Chitinophaga rhizophila TaxID=2866212 RepID=A0ABS7G7Z5_9BACT|nr:FecR family protein [Chitinophaga rhizophila]MBW8683764.1 FecR domain-containing protein [Chitinophaga rhizophila]
MMHRDILKRFADGSVTPEEASQYREELARLSTDEIESLMDAYEDMLDAAPAYEPVDQRLLSDIQQRIAAWNRNDHKPVVKPLFRKIWIAAAAAAAIVLLLAGGIWWRETHSERAYVTNHFETIIPGHDGAILTLSDGSSVTLDSTSNGLIAEEGGSQATSGNGLLSYNVNTSNEHKLVYHTIRTANGRQFRLILPDGTKVWLNAGSSVTFPTIFPGNERRVQITGEVYLEVAANTQQPFYVTVNDTYVVNVLGTSFNVNAYSNDNLIRTTLVDGAVNVEVSGKIYPLKPSQQLSASMLSSTASTTEVEVNKIIAWKDGRFDFDGLQLRDALSQLERWYDIDVVYEGDVPDVVLYGKADRSISLETIIGALRGPDVNFRIEGRKLIVSSIR